MGKNGLIKDTILLKMLLHGEFTNRIAQKEAITMTENEAIRDLQYLIEEYSAYPPETGVSATVGSLQYCITALKEIQQYREIGTVEECREAVEKQQKHGTEGQVNRMSDLKITKCTGEGQGSCKRCNDYGIWNRHWMSMLYKIEGYEGCYCSECVKEIKAGKQNE